MQSKFFGFLEQNSLAIGRDSSSAIRRHSALGVQNFPRREVDFTKDIVKSPTRQCKWRPTSEMSNATLFKHSEDENDDFAHC